ncbi:MAG TPA: NADP-dependent oxidoreductase [Gemmatimonadaceae bacterium]|nr:NADP-dependent oxidoreductase [Gemmatimonadaceae bacterium]
MSVSPASPSPSTHRVVRLTRAGDPAALVLETRPAPAPAPGEALVRVRAAAITRDELTWPSDRLPAVPSYELSGTVVAVGPGVSGVAAGDAVFALAPFDRDGVAADAAVVPAGLLAPKPERASHAEAAAIPLPALSAWQALFVHGGLEAGQRVLVTGATGGVGQFAVQLARWRGAHVVALASPATAALARRLGAHEVVDRTAPNAMHAIAPVDLVFDTVGGEALAAAPRVLARGGKIVTVAHEPPEGVEALYFVVVSDRSQLVEIGRLVDEGVVRVEIDATFPLERAAEAFARVAMPGKRGKVVLTVNDE